MIRIDTTQSTTAPLPASFQPWPCLECYVYNAYARPTCQICGRPRAEVEKMKEPK